MRAGDARGRRDVGKRAVAPVAIEDVLPAGQSWRPAGHGQALVAAQPGFRDRRRRQVEIDVIGGEEIELAVAVVVEEGAAGAPAHAGRFQPRLFRGLRERPVASIAKEPVRAPERDEQVDPPVVVVIAGARALSPSAECQASAAGDVLERAVALVAVEMTGRLLALRKTFERRAVGDEGVEPPVVVVVERSDAGARGLEQEAVGANTAVDGRGRETRACRDLREGERQPIGCLLARRGQHRTRENDGGEPEVAGKEPHHFPDSLDGACGASFFAISKCLRASATAPAWVSACASA